MRAGILTGGGDAPGLNAAIRAVTTRLHDRGHSVSGILNGWRGALEGEARELDLDDVRDILSLGGTMLGTSRTNPLKEEDGIPRVLASLRRNGIEALVAIGGDDTLSVAARLGESGYPVVGIPKTIDNDLSETEFCIGFDTAVGIVTEAIDRLHTTASSHHRVMVVEVMGRDTGWVALAGGMAGGADMILIPEFESSLREVTDHLYARRGAGRYYSIIVVAEGVTLPELSGPQGEGAGAGATDAFGHVRLSERGIGDGLSRLIERETGFETRVTVLGHLQRGGSPSSVDRLWATRLGVEAADLVHRGRSGVIPIRRDGGVKVVPLATVVREQRRVPRDLHDLSRVFT